VIDLNKVSVQLAQIEVLREISLEVQKEEIVGLIGPAASGKSVLIKTIAGLLSVSSGELLIHDERVEHLPVDARERWQKRVGMSFQNNALFDGFSVFENVAFPLRRQGVGDGEIVRRVEARLNDVGLLQSKERFPMELSGGMQKRVGIARATITSPEIGLFDEPTAGLDPVAAAMILDLVVRLTRSLHMATVIVSNDLAVLLPICDRVVMLYEGEAVYEGLAADLKRCDREEVVQFVTGSNEGPL
jgi:phospholipid/cholesterol/gamma-HCH transport system ATP-binding protein